MIPELVKKLKIIKGNVLGINISNDKILTALYNNDQIELGLLNNDKGKKFKGAFLKMKKVNIRKFRKKFKKKKTEYIIIEMDSMFKYVRYLIRDSVYMNAKETIMYGKLDLVDLDLIEKRYKRYNVKLKEEVKGNDFILTIDNTKSKNHFFKDKFYFISDSFYMLFDAIGDLLTS